MKDSVNLLMKTLIAQGRIKDCVRDWSIIFYCGGSNAFKKNLEDISKRYGLPLLWRTLTGTIGGSLQGVMYYKKLSSWGFKIDIQNMMRYDILLVPINRSALYTASAMFSPSRMILYVNLTELTVGERSIRPAGQSK